MPELLNASRGAARAFEKTDGPFLTFDLAGEIRRLREEQYWQSGRNSRTLVKYPDLRVVLTAIRAGTTIHQHQAAGRMSLQTVEGRLRMHAGTQEFYMPAGSMLVLDRDMPHDIVALADSAFLLTIAWPEDLEHA